MFVCKNVQAPKAEAFGGPKKTSFSPYFLWCNKHRAEFFEKAAQNGKVSLPEVTKQLSDFYKTNVTEEEKTALDFESQAIKKTYKEEFVAWKNSPQYQDFLKAKSASEKSKELKKAKTEVQSLGMPSKPKSSYLLYSLSRQEDLKKQAAAKGEKYSFGNAGKIIAAEWKNLTAEQMAPILAQVAESKVEYEKKLAEFKETDAYKAYSAKVESAKEKKIKAKKSAKDEVKLRKQQEKQALKAAKGETVKKPRAKRSKTGTVAESSEVTEAKSEVPETVAVSQEEEAAEKVEEVAVSEEEEVAESEDAVMEEGESPEVTEQGAWKRKLVLVDTHVRRVNKYGIFVVGPKRTYTNWKVALVAHT